MGRLVVVVAVAAVVVALGGWPVPSPGAGRARGRFDYCFGPGTPEPAPAEVGGGSPCIDAYLPNPAHQLVEAFGLEWVPNELTVQVGGRIDLRNQSDYPHSFVIAGHNDTAPVPVPPSADPDAYPLRFRPFPDPEDTVVRLSHDIGPGVYTFYCAVPGHRQGGMEGTLTVVEPVLPATAAMAVGLAGTPYIIGVSHVGTPTP